jgi:isopenicillin-N epimerase
LLFSLDPAVAHLNHGSFGAVPIGVQRAQQRLRDEMEANPMRFLTLGRAERIAHVRAHIAAFLGADPEHSALVDNASTGTALVVNALDLQPGDEIVSTNHGYGGVQLTIDEACRRTGAVSRLVRLPLAPGDDAVVAAIREACSARTKLVVIDAISSPTARMFPTKRIIAAAREVGAAVFVDAAHAPGTLATPVREIGADFWVGNLHKWAYAPRGTALFAVAPPWSARIRPMLVSWQHAAGFPASVEDLAARDYTPWLATPTALFTLRTLGVDRVRAHNDALAAYGQRVVGAAMGVDELPEQPGVGMRIVPLPPGVASTPATAIALRQRIVDEVATYVAVNAWDGRGLLRLSANIYNRADEYERLASRLPSLLPGK